MTVEREEQNSLAGQSQCQGRGLLPETPLELKRALGANILKKKSLGIRFSVLHEKLLPFGLRSLMLVWGLFKYDCNLSLKALLHEIPFSLRISFLQNHLTNLVVNKLFCI